MHLRRSGTVCPLTVPFICNQIISNSRPLLRRKGVKQTQMNESTDDAIYNYCIFWYTVAYRWEFRSYFVCLHGFVEHRHVMKISSENQVFPLFITSTWTAI